MKPILLAMLLVLAFLCDEIRGQGSGGLDLARSVRFQRGLFEFDAIGRLGTSFLYSDSRFGAIDICQDEVLLKEVELSPSQEKEFSDFVQRWKKSYQKIEDDYTENLSLLSTPDEAKQAEDKLKEQFKNAEDKARRELDDVLLPFQMKLLNQFAFRCLVRNYGIGPLLQNERLRESLELNEAEAKRISRNLGALKPEIIRQATDAKQEALDVFFEPFSSEQRLAVAKKWPHLVEKDHRVEWVSIGLGDVLRKWYEENKPADGELLLKRPFIQSSPSSKFVLSPYAKRDALGDEIDVFVTLWEYDAFLDYLRIDDKQIERVDNIIDQTYAEASRLNKQLNFQEPISKKEYALVEKRIGAEQKKLKDHGTVLLKQELGEDRWRLLGEYSNKMTLRSIGPLYDILDGPLSETLDLSAEQREAIEKSAEDAIDAVNKSTRMIEQTIIDKVSEQLSDSASKSFKELLGDPIDDVPLSIQMLLLFM